MEHKHHELGNGNPHITDRDELCIIIGNPLAKRPRYFLGHCKDHGVKDTAMRHQAKRMSALSAKAWVAFLHTLGKDAWLAVHHEPKPKPSKMKITSIKGEGGNITRRY